MIFIEVNTTNGFKLKLNPKQLSLYSEAVDSAGTHIVMSGQEFTIVESVAVFEGLIAEYITANGCL